MRKYLLCNQGVRENGLATNQKVADSRGIAAWSTPDNLAASLDVMTLRVREQNFLQCRSSSIQVW
jgi:hypothetical protein